MSFEEGGRQEEEGESGVPRDVEPMVEVILERRKLVPVSRRKQAGGRVQGERNKGRLERLGRRLRALGSSGKKKFLMALHKYWIEELI